VAGEKSGEIICQFEGAEVNARDSEGETALMAASAGGHRDIVQKLLSKGAQVNAKSKPGVTALMYASLSGHREVVQLLLSKRRSMPKTII
jgi:ankyrin repeat protein